MNNTGGSADDRNWKLECDKSGNGYAVIRFLPAPDGEDLPFVNYTVMPSKVLAVGTLKILLQLLERKILFLSTILLYGTMELMQEKKLHVRQNANLLILVTSML